MRALLVAFDERAERGRVGREFVRPVADDDQEREVRDPGREGGEPVEGFGIGPGQVVQEQNDGCVQHRQDRHDPVEAVAHSGRVRHPGGVRRLETERGADDVVPTAQEIPALRPAHSRQDGLHDLADDAERQPLLVLAALARVHRDPLCGGAGARRRDQCGLAQPGFTREGEQPAARYPGHAVGGVPESRQRAVDGPELLVAFEERPVFGDRLPQPMGHVVYRFL